MGGRKWTEEEIEILDNEWGITPIKKISTKINRTPDAIRRKAYDLGKVGFLESGDYIKLQSFADALGYERDTFVRKMKNDKFPMRKTKCNSNNGYYVINIDKFWKWAEKNQDKIDFSRMKKYSLGAEPSWVDNKRKLDKELSKGHSCKWRKDDEFRLKVMVNTGKYSIDDLSKYFKRTKNSIYQKIRKMELEGKVVYLNKKIKTPFSTEEIDSIEDKIMKVIYFDQLMRLIDNRSTYSIKHLFYKRYGTAVIKDIQEQIRNTRNAS